MASEFIARVQAVITDVDGASGGGTTSSGRPLITGTADPFSTIDVYDGTALLGVVSANGQGGWSLQLSAPLFDGIHDLSAVQVGDYGVKSASGYFAITVAVSENEHAGHDELSSSASTFRLVDNHADAVPFFPPNFFTARSTSVVPDKGGVAKISRSAAVTGADTEPGLDPHS